MGSIKKFIIDKRAGANGLVFIVLLVMSIFIFVSFIEPVKIAYTELALTVGYKKGLDKMQQEGGLTQQIEADLKNYLANWGLDKSKINVNGTVAPAAGKIDPSHWGKEIRLSIDYLLTYKNYTFLSLLSFSSEDKVLPLHIEGKTTNYYYDNN